MAKAFAERFPVEEADIQRQHTDKCLHGDRPKPGTSDVYVFGNKVFFLAYTKDEYFHDSRLEWIGPILNQIKLQAAIFNVKFVKVPALGCGLGKLRWDDVLPLMVSNLGPSQTTTFYVYPPSTHNNASKRK